MGIDKQKYSHYPHNSNGIRRNTPIILRMRDYAIFALLDKKCYLI